MVKIKKPFLKNAGAAYITAIFCTLLWGTAFPFIKLGYSAFSISENDIGSKLLFAGLRFAAAGAMVYLFLIIKNKRFVTPAKGDILPVTVLGLVQTFGQYIFTYIGIGFTSGTNTSIITACASFFTVLFVPLFFKSDKLTALKIIGCILGFSGIIAVNRGGSVSYDTLFGDIMILFSTICAAAGNIISKKIAVGRDPVCVTSFQLLLGGAALTACGLICGGNLSFSDFEGTAVLAWLAFVSAAAFSLWTALLKYHPASKITVFNLLVPVFGTVLSGIMLGEDVFRIETLVSLVLIAAGIAAVNLSGNFRIGGKSREN